MAGLGLAATLLALVGCALPAPADVPDATGPTVPANGVAVEVVREGSVATAVLDDTPGGRALACSLPITLPVEDRFGVALVGRLPTALGVGPSSLSTAFTVGEIGYAPDAGAIAIFHGDPTARVAPPGVVRLGSVTGDLEVIAHLGGPVTIRPAG